MSDISEKVIKQNLADGRVKLTVRVTLKCPHKKCGTTVNNSSVIDVQASAVKSQTDVGRIYAMKLVVVDLLNHEKKMHPNVPSLVRKIGAYKQYIP